MKIGVLGTGFGMVHLQTFAKHPLVDEVVFFSRTQQKVDVVTIALPPKIHGPVAIRAMEQGKDVICEIPLCRKKNRSAYDGQSVFTLYPGANDLLHADAAFLRCAGAYRGDL